MTTIAIDINNLWGEGDDDYDSSESDEIVTTTTTKATLPTINCKATNLIELSDFVTSSNFYSNYRSKTPVVIQSFINQFPIMMNQSSKIQSLLSTAYIQEHQDQSRIEINVLHANDKIHFFGNGLCTKSTMLITDVFSEAVMNGTYAGEPFYCRLRPIPKSFTTLFNLSFDANEAVDLETTDSFETSILFKKQLCACWIGSQGTITPLHFDTCHGLLAVLHGVKKVTLFPPEDSMYLYRDDSTFSDNPNSSKVDLEVYNTDDGSTSTSTSTSTRIPRYPPLNGSSYQEMYSRMEETSPKEVFLKDGEMLYIPPGFWHTVENVTATISVLLPFDMAGNEDLHEALHLL